MNYKHWRPTSHFLRKFATYTASSAALVLVSPSCFTSSAPAAVVISDGFGDADLDNNGVALEAYDVDVNGSGAGTPGDTYAPVQQSGADTIFADGNGIVVLAGGGNDTISAAGGSVSVEGGGGHDRIRTGAGEDRVSGGPGMDSIATGAGNDRVEALDGRRDRVICGRGAGDTVTADSFDIVTSCERRARVTP